MNLKKIQILIAFLSISYTLYGDSIVIVPTHTNDNGGNIPPVLDYNLATQEFTIDFGEVDEISSGRVVIHDDCSGNRFTNGLTSDLYVFMNNRDNIKLLRMGNRYGDSSSD